MTDSRPSILRPSVPSAGPRVSGHADQIDYEIKGHEMQFVEIELDPGESAIAEAGVHPYGYGVRRCVEAGGRRV